VQFNELGAYDGRLSCVCVRIANPRYTAASYGSSGVLSTAGGCHVFGFHDRDAPRFVPSRAMESVRFEASWREQAVSATTTRRPARREERCGIDKFSPEVHADATRGASKISIGLAR